MHGDYFFSTVIFRSLVAAAPFDGSPVTLTTKSPRAASSAALILIWLSLSLALTIGAAGSSETPFGTLSNFMFTSSPKFLPRFTLIVTVFISPCLIFVLKVGVLRENVSSGWLTTPRPESLLLTPGPPDVPLLSQPMHATEKARTLNAIIFFMAKPRLGT